MRHAVWRVAALLVPALAVVDHGTMTLPMLERQIDAFIARSRSASTSVRP